ncbi:hypothetical protein HC766_07795 [Candidatus Gracilibacteria bacterium]|nr:hypothetical protein [Candidatus Gracilibacteria bacterium]
MSNTYDANGNILTLQRYGKTGTNTFGLVDNLTYGYLSNGNKLLKIDDSVSGNAFANDFRDVSGNDYSFSVDGKMLKDGNKGITSIRYNYLDLVSSSRFANNDSVSYWYSSTGNRIQRKVVKAGQPDSYTIYDGEMVYTYTGTSPSLAGFGIAEIQNGEGRYVNGKLEYGYTDHVGNLRLSYKDSLGVAFITQSQHYDPWSNVNSGSEYQLAGIQGDKYLVSGKESDNLTGNILLDWRDYDSITGRMNSYDPASTEGGQMSISPFAYSWNNPVSLNDPDGRCPMCIGFMIGMFTSAIGNMASGKMPSNFGQFLLPGVTGAIGGGVGAGMGSIFGQAGTFGGAVLRGAAGGAISGGVSGGVGSMLNGGNFGNGFCLRPSRRLSRSRRRPRHRRSSRAAFRKAARGLCRTSVQALSARVERAISLRQGVPGLTRLQLDWMPGLQSRSYLLRRFAQTLRARVGVHPLRPRRSGCRSGTVRSCCVRLQFGRASQATRPRTGPKPVHNLAVLHLSVLPDAAGLPDCPRGFQSRPSLAAVELRRWSARGAASAQLRLGGQPRLEVRQGLKRRDRRCHGWAQPQLPASQEPVCDSVRPHRTCSGSNIEPRCCRSGYRHLRHRRGPRAAGSLCHTPVWRCCSRPAHDRRGRCCYRPQPLDRARPVQLCGHLRLIVQQQRVRLARGSMPHGRHRRRLRLSITGYEACSLAIGRRRSGLLAPSTVVQL